MQISAECRWFTDSRTVGESLKNWFLDPAIHGQPARADDHREDCYLLDPGQTELGIKRRGSNPGVEIKGLVYVDHTPLRCGSLTASIERWGKWTSAALDLAAFGTVAIRKTRWLRTFNTSNGEAAEIQTDGNRPATNQDAVTQGCNVEVTEIEVASKKWFSFSLEAFGQLENVDASIRHAAKVLTSRNLPEMPAMIAANYPRWISEHCGA